MSWTDPFTRRSLLSWGALTGIALTSLTSNAKGARPPWAGGGRKKKTGVAQFSSIIGMVTVPTVFAGEDTPPSGDGELLYSPPGWNGGDPTLASSFPGYTELTATSGAENLSLTNGVDYFINLGTKTWSSSSSRTYGLQITGGRNVVIVGGTLNFTSTNNLDDSVGILISDGNNEGIVHLEGLNVAACNPITIRTRRAVQIQNCRLIADTYQQDSEGGAGIHCDVIQVWGTNVDSNGHGPCAGIYMHKVTAYTTNQGFSKLTETDPAVVGRTNPYVEERTQVDIHPWLNADGSYDGGNMHYTCDTPTGNNNGPYTAYSGDTYFQLPTFGGGAGTRGIDDIAINKSMSPLAYFQYKIHDGDDDSVLYTSAASPSGGSGLAIAKEYGNYLKFTHADLDDQRLIIGYPPESEGAVFESAAFPGVFVHSSVPGPSYESPLYQ